MYRWFAIVNPVAGKGHGLSDWPIISKHLHDNEIAYDAVFTERKYHATELAVMAVNKGYRNIIVVGGDGTLHEVVNGLFIQKRCRPLDVTLAVIAVGTGNDWIRMYGIPRKYTESIRSIVSGNTFLQDVAKISYYESMVYQERYMANVAGVGFDALVNRKYNKIKERGYYNPWMYLLSMFIALFTYRAKLFKIWVDGAKVVDSMVFSGAVGIGKYNGGGMQQTPMAVADDGLMDLTVIRRIGKLAVFYHMKSLYNGNIYRVPRTMFLRGSKMRIETYPESNIEIDGEALGYSPFEFTVIPKAIKVIVGEKFADENR